MVKVTNSLGYGTVGVERSDERLAAVEEAKLTGQELQSVGAKGNDYVDRETLRLEVEKVSNAEDVQPFTKEVEDVNALNLQKAREHNEYSRKLMEDRVKAFNAKRTADNDDPLYEAELRNQQNIRIAREHTERNIEFAKEFERNQAGVQEEVRALMAEEVDSADPITVLGKNSQVTDISEKPAKDLLKKKDRVIYGEDSYEAEAVAKRSAAPTDHRVGAALEVTDDPLRIHEEVLDVKAQAKRALEGAAAPRTTSVGKAEREAAKAEAKEAEKAEKAQKAQAKADAKAEPKSEDKPKSDAKD